MLPHRTVVLDVGKTLTKLSLWDSNASLVAQNLRANQPVEGNSYRALDAAGIETWLADTLREFASRGPISAIIPVGHGAAAAIVRDGMLVCPVCDYEDGLPVPMRQAYDLRRDAFALTGSPALPNGLNLGAQLHRLESLKPALLSGDASIVPWPQYWAWKLSGVAASEVTSLGCHSDLWHPGSNQHSELSKSRGWAARLPPLRHASQALGPVSAEWVARTGINADAQVYCGLHDSNASLLAARGFAEIADHEATVLSTGTWFVSMRTPAKPIDLTQLPEARDCLVNVDVDGRAIPSARFMGGREIEMLGAIDSPDDQATALAAVPKVLSLGTMALPGTVSGVGPYPKGRGGWNQEPDDIAVRRAAIALYAALMVDTSLELIGSQERLLIEGRFAQAEVFVRALAALRPDMQVYVYGGSGGLAFGVPYGALRLLDPKAPPPGTLRKVSKLDLDLSDYKRRWRELAAQGEAT